MINLQFKKLRDEWTSSPAMLTSPKRATQHKAAQEIIELGEEAIPLIVNELKEGHYSPFWFVILKDISGIDAGTGEYTISGAKQRWIKWADAR